MTSGLVQELFILVISQTGGGDTVDTFAQYGVLGVAVLALAIFARQAYVRERDRSDKLEAEVIRLNGVIIDKHAPALESALSAIREVTTLLEEIRTEREVKARLEARERRRSSGP